MTRVQRMGGGRKCVIKLLCYIGNGILLVKGSLWEVKDTFQNSRITTKDIK